MKKSGQDYTGGKINFSIVECTRGKKHNHYCYVGERTELADPVPVPIKIKNEDGTFTHKTVTYKHKNKVNKIKKADVKQDVKQPKLKKKIAILKELDLLNNLKVKVDNQNFPLLIIKLIL